MTGFTERSDEGQWRLRGWLRGLRETASGPFAKRQRDGWSGADAVRETLKGWYWYIVVSAALGVLCAFLGPFGTFADMSPAARVAYWVTIFVVECMQVLAALVLLAWLGDGRWPMVVLGVGASVLTSVPATAEVALLEYLLRNANPFDSIGSIFTKVLLLTLAVTIPFVLIRERLRTPAPPPAAVPVAAGGDGESLLKRVKPGVRGELWALQMEDHYLRVHTSSGNDLILHRMSDAVAEVAGVEGRQVHRSWWVARAAIAAAERDGRRLVLVLKSGLKVPVSRANVAAIKDAGWV